MPGAVYLIPTVLAEGAINVLPAYITDAVKDCSIFFVENERTARRYLKLLWKEMVIDDYEWVNMKEVKPETAGAFLKAIKEEKTIGIISEAGCPGVADPGGELVKIAQEKNVVVKPLVGPNSILLALMASGLNGQCFSFLGYLPIDNGERLKTLRQLENESRTKRCTQIFIETPYRNNAMLEAMIKVCSPSTRICVAVDLTSTEEWVKTKTVAQWQSALPQIHKRPAIFLMLAG